MGPHLHAAVSIVIINHNYARFLREAIDSALVQTAVNLEAIVVDDGSTDGSDAIIAEYDDRIRAVFKPAGGHVSAFNAGAAAARGEVIIFLDADDKLYPDCVEAVLAAWRPGLSKVQFQLDTVDADGRSQAMTLPYFPEDLDAGRVLGQAIRFGTYPWTVSSGNAFAGDFIRRITPIDPEIFFKAPDGFANKLAPLYGEVETLRRPLGVYRVHGGNLWAQSGRGLKVEPFLRNVRYDLVLHSHFRELAAAKGFAVPPLDLAYIPQQWENRLMAFRFGGDKYPIAEDTRVRLLVMALRSTRSAPNTSRLGRLFWAVWLFFLTVAPRRSVAWVFQRFRAQSGRAAAAILALKLVRGAAGRRG